MPRGPDLKGLLYQSSRAWAWRQSVYREAERLEAHLLVMSPLNSRRGPYVASRAIYELKQSVDAAALKRFTAGFQITLPSLQKKTDVIH